MGLEEADVIIMVVDGRRTNWRRRMWSWHVCCCAGGKPVFLAVNKMDAPDMYAAAENFRQLGFKNVCPDFRGTWLGDWRFAR